MLSALTLSANLQPGGTSSISGITGTFTGPAAGTYVIDDDGLGLHVSARERRPWGDYFDDYANGSTNILIPGMSLSIGPLLQLGTHTVTVSPSSQSVVQRLKQFSELQAGAGGVLQKRQDAFNNINTDIAKRIEVVQERIEKEMEVLRKKFAAMERAQANAQSLISQSSDDIRLTSNGNINSPLGDSPMRRAASCHACYGHPH